MAKPSKTTAVRATDRDSALRFSGVNALLIGAGLVSVTVGFVLLAGGSTVAAPLLLVLGYAVLIPIGIIKG